MNLTHHVPESARLPHRSPTMPGTGPGKPPGHHVADRTADEHLAAVLSGVSPRAPHSVRLTPDSAAKRLYGLMLAEDVFAELAVPPWPHSAMDGYLVRDADVTTEDGDSVPVTLAVTGDVPAGAQPREVGPGKAVRIMTGAPVAATNDQVEGLRVIPVEDTDQVPGPHQLPDTVTVTAVNPQRRHIRRAGEGCAAGELIAARGSRIGAGALAALLSCGVSQVQVHPVPRVLVISTGSELVDPGAPLAPGQIPDSNLAMISGLVLATGPVQVMSAHVSDGPEGAEELASLLATHAGPSASTPVDLIVSTGGISAGAYEVVRNCATDAARRGDGVEAWFGNAPHKPGAPQGLVRWHEVPWVCLPGNPVAAWVSCVLYVVPALDVLRGCAPAGSVLDRPHIEARAVHDFPRAKGRDVVVPVRVELGGGAPRVSAYHEGAMGSHLTASLAGVTAFVYFAAGSSGPAEGEKVTVYLNGQL